MIVHLAGYRIIITTALVASVALLTMAACSSGGDGPNEVGGAKVAEPVEIAAPIESVQIVKVSAKPPNATLVIVSGGLNSCETFQGYELSGEVDPFQVRITNLRTGGADVPCTTDYGTVEHNIELPSNAIAGCDTYQVEVNGVMYQVEASCPAIGAGPELEKMEKVLAPIIDAQVMALESFPVQYRLQIESALPNGCVEFGAYDVSREGETIKVKVTNLEPADKSIACDQEFRIVKTTVSLGTGADYNPATAYTVEVNDVSTGFVPDAAPEPVAAGPELGQEFELVEFELKVGETITVNSDGLTVELVEIVEDSRCPADVTCIWAGRALIRVIVSSPNDVLGFGAVDMTLEAGDAGEAASPRENRVVGKDGAYTLALLGLAPQPISTVKLTSQDYMATLKVVKVPIGQ